MYILIMRDFYLDDRYLRYVFSVNDSEDLIIFDQM